MTNTMTPAMLRALIILWTNGVVYAGRNTVRHCDYRVAFPALKALATRGFIRLEDIPGGGTRGVAA